MVILKFNKADVARLVEHARKAPQHTRGFGDEEDPRPQIILVKDEGIYLMSNGKPHLPNPEKLERSFVVYAEGYDPNIRDRGDVWDDARDAVGGDDFAEFLPIEWFELALQNTKPKRDKHIKLSVTADSIIMS